MALACVASAATNVDFLRRGRLVPPLEPEDPGMVTVIAQSDSVGTGFFQQQLDHKDPSKGTFRQKFWWNMEYWAGPGSPVVLFTPGEIAAAGYGAYLTNATLTGLFAQEIKGAVVMVEHRFWGDSSPYDVLTAETLQLLTLEQSIADFVYFAKNAPLPFDKNNTSNAGNAPWVFAGGSYSGALSAWTQSMSPGTFWAYHASSAPVEAIYDYWQYFVPVQQGMPKNCSKDISLVIDYMDNVWKKGSPAEKLALKTKFGLESLEHEEDVMAVLENGPWLWQSNSFYSNYSGFYQFCDAIENVTAGAAVTPDANGVGLETALAGYANWTKSELIPGYCRNFGYQNLLDTGCMDTYNPKNLIFTDRSVDNKADLQWQWMLCNEPFGYWQDGAPRSRPSLVSRLVTGDYWQRQCELFFPTTNGFTYGSALSPDNNVHQVNKHTQGWRLEDTTRLLWVNGEFDPWKTSGMSSEFRPGGPLESTEKHPVQVIPGGFHCSDLRLKNAEFNAGVQKVVDIEVAQIVKWVSEFLKK
ncbi:putative serine protease K12H4.7 [Venustampulla echinocandica]|uniref:Putative serine protease K12H4.7 n=1 Tax=Venustampulla echinocandica TaxID=2656787 RepID=A0A370TVF5_9HELO|nr:putative serine protease K12H4.7 [Venustampulla echinocandica]RDL39517.1 putative serine protease K12H4.7 [Venustampulla echinocandica]